MEFMSTVKGLDHLPRLERINAYSAVRRVSLFATDRASSSRWFFISEGRIGIYDVFYLFGRKFLFLFLFLLLKLSKVLIIRIIRVETSLFRAVLFLSIIILMLISMLKMLMILLKLWLTWHRISVKSIAIEVHLYVLWIHTLDISHVAHHARNIRE
jgi:hypothetical protein